MGLRPLDLAQWLEVDDRRDEELAFLRTNHPELARDVTEGEHPVAVASRLIQEDLGVLVHDDTWRLQAVCVCFASRWSLEQDRHHP